MQGLTLLTMECKSINSVSYNCHGFCSSSGYVKQLLEHCDILCLQEHWLLYQQLCDLNICENFAVTGVSGMVSDCVIHGRPYGGCAVYFRNTLSSSISHCQIVSRRFCGIKVKLAGGCILFVVCVYIYSLMMVIPWTLSSLVKCLVNWRHFCTLSIMTCWLWLEILMLTLLILIVLELVNCSISCRLLV